MKRPVGYAKRPVRYVKRPVRYVKSPCLSCKPTSQGECGRSHFLPVLPSAGLKKAQACSPGPLPDSRASLIISYSGRACQLFFRDFGAQRKPPYRIDAAAADFTLLSDHPPVVSRRRRVSSLSPSGYRTRAACSFRQAALGALKIRTNGLEPSRSYPLEPETSASTNSATCALSVRED